MPSELGNRAAPKEGARAARSMIQTPMRSISFPLLRRRRDSPTLYGFAFLPPLR